VVFQGSRYVDVEVIKATASDGSTRRTLATRRLPAREAVHEQTVSGGERLDLLADRFYGDPTRYWLILDANPNELNPFRLLQPGRRVRIPRNEL
jgi:nucleoid-associated protein YgaU